MLQAEFVINESSEYLYEQVVDTNTDINTTRKREFYNLFNVPDEGYSRNTPCTLNYKSTFLTNTYS